MTVLYIVSSTSIVHNQPLRFNNLKPKPILIIHQDFSSHKTAIEGPKLPKPLPREATTLQHRISRLEPILGALNTHAETFVMPNPPTAHQSPLSPSSHSWSGWCEDPFSLETDTMPETPAYVLDDLLSPTSLGDNMMPEPPVLLGDGF